MFIVAGRIAVDNIARTGRNSRLAHSCLEGKIDHSTEHHTLMHQQDNRRRRTPGVDDSPCFAVGCWRSRPLDDATEER